MTQAARQSRLAVFIHALYSGYGPKPKGVLTAAGIESNEAQIHHDHGFVRVGNRAAR
jgi:hypothetical protein